MPHRKPPLGGCVETRNRGLLAACAFAAGLLAACAAAPLRGNTPTTIARDRGFVMRQMWTRNGSAALLFAMFGVVVVILAVMSRSGVLAAVAVVAFIAAVAATRGFPIDRNW